MDTLQTILLVAVLAVIFIAMILMLQVWAYGESRENLMAMGMTEEEADKALLEDRVRMDTWGSYPGGGVL
jgi:hypothetical protein